MKYVRGIVFFKNNSLVDVRKNFKNFSMDLINFKFAKSYILNGTKTDGTIMFLSGQVEDSVDINILIGAIEEKAAQDIEIKNYDISFSSDGIFEQIMPGEFDGNYVSLRVISPFMINNLEDLVQDLANIVDVKDVLLREIKDDESEKCVAIDLITSTDSAKVEYDARIFLEENDLHLSNKSLIIDKLS